MITVPKHPTNTDAEIDALAATCERLQGFDDGLSLEQVDGMLCVLAASPRQLTPQEWLPLLFDDSFERAFADPKDHARALQTLLARLRVLCAQLDPEALFDDPDALRLDPIVADWSDAAKAKLITEQQLDAEAALELDTVVTGGDWATGFFHAVEQLGALWDVPDGNEEAEAAFNAAFDQINVLTMLPGHERFAQLMATYYPANSTDKEPAALPTRDDLLADACMAVQDLRMYWVDFSPKTATIRVEAKPGRNDPCPCGSGKKYKKCHGATA